MVLLSGVEVPQFQDNLPGPDWLEGFLKRHPVLKVRRTENITKSQAAVDIPMIKKYFDELKISIVNVPASNIYNFDESAFSDDPGSKKLLFRRGMLSSDDLNGYQRKDNLRSSFVACYRY